MQKTLPLQKHRLQIARKNQASFFHGIFFQWIFSIMGSKPKQTMELTCIALSLKYSV